MKPPSARLTSLMYQLHAEFILRKIKIYIWYTSWQKYHLCLFRFNKILPEISTVYHFFCSQFFSFNKGNLNFFGLSKLPYYNFLSGHFKLAFRCKKHTNHAQVMNLLLQINAFICSTCQIIFYVKVLPSKQTQWNDITFNQCKISTQK